MFWRGVKVEEVIPIFCHAVYTNAIALLVAEALGLSARHDSLLRINRAV
jgi:hypothetical protein